MDRHGQNSYFTYSCIQCFVAVGGWKPSVAKTVFIRHAENALSPIFLPGAHIRLCEKKLSSGPLLLLKQAVKCQTFSRSVTPHYIKFQAVFSMYYLMV